jgi:hypothetical protein
MTSCTSLGSERFSRRVSAEKAGTLAQVPARTRLNQAARSTERILERQPAAQEWPSTCTPVETKGFAHGADLVDESVHHPEGGVIGVIGLAAPELIVEDDRPSAIAEVRQVLQIVVRQARATVEHQRGLRTSAGGELPHDLVPGAVPPERHSPFGRRPHH